MNGPMFMRRGASWVHQRRSDDEPGGFAHSICGLSFAIDQVIELGDTEPMTCPECLTADNQAQREAMLAALPIPTFHPKPSADDAAAWMGPKVEVLNVVDPDGGVESTVFLDGIEVPFPHLTVETVDPGRGDEVSEWERDTRDMLGDVTMTSRFRSLVMQERNYALQRHRHLFEDDYEPALKEG